MKQEIINNLEKQYINICKKCDRLELMIAKTKNIKIHKDFIELKKAEFDILIEYKEILYQQLKYIYDKIDIESR